MKSQIPNPKFQKNVLLKNYTTFRIGGPAKYFFVAKNKTELIETIKTAKNLKLPFFILGGGSNLLVSDEGFNGLVIKMQNAPKESFRLPTGQAKSKTIYVEAGVTLGQLVSIATKNNLTGLEWAVGIPGTVGGAIWGNAGAFGKSMKDIVKEVEYGEVGFPSEIRLLKIKNRDCEFSYRDSIFKNNKNLIILSATLQLKKGKKSEIEKKVKENLNYRKERQPLNFPSAGSIFKNPTGFFAGELGEENKLSSSSFAAARLIERCGLKGKKVGNVKISEIHSNFIVNLGRGTAKDVTRLIKIIKNKVKKKFGVVLEEEIQFLGF